MLLQAHYQQLIVQWSVLLRALYHQFSVQWPMLLQALHHLFSVQFQCFCKHIIIHSVYNGQCFYKLFAISSQYTVANTHSSSLPSVQAPTVSSQLAELYCDQFLHNLTLDKQLIVLSKLFASICKTAGIVKIPSDFLELAVDEMKHLQEYNHTNVIYHFV